jgi:hypothetical protein
LLHPNHGLPPGETRTHLDVIRDKRNHHPPGFPLLVAVCAEVTTRTVPGPFPQQLLLGAQIASALGALLLVLPSYWIGRLLFEKGVGFGVALLCQVLPVLARDAADGLSDILHLSLAALGLLFALRAFRRPRIGQFLLTGFFSGLAYLVRPEGLTVVIATTALLGLWVFSKRFSFQTAASFGTALAVGAAISAGPYMLLIGGFTNKPSVARAISPDEENPRLKMIQGQAQLAGAPIFAKWIPDDARGLHRVGVVLLGILEELSKTTHYSVLVLAVAGFWFLRSRFRTQPELVLLLLYAGIHLGLLVMLGMRRGTPSAAGGYLSERHTIPVAFVAVIFAVGALKPLLEGLPVLSMFRGLVRHPAGPRVVLACIVLSCVPPLGRKLHAQQGGHLPVASYLREHLHPEDHVYDPYEWVRFYSGHSVYVIPTDWYKAPGRGRWLVWEVGDSVGPSKSPRWHDTKKLLEDPAAKLVFPETAGTEPPAKGSIQLYWLQFTPEEVAADAQLKAHDEAQGQLRKRY